MHTEVVDLKTSPRFVLRKIVDFTLKSPGDRSLVVEKSPYERLVEGVHNLTNGDAQAHISNEHCKVLSMDNGEIHTSEMWFSNSVVAEQRTASPLLVGDSALLDDEIWPEFLSQPTPQSDVDMRDVPSSPLSDKTQEGLHPLPCHTSKNIGEALDEIHTAESTSETKNFVHSNIASELSSSVKTKVVRWPEAILLGKEFKRQRSGIQSTSSNDIKDNSCPNRARPVQCALVQFDTTLPQDFQHIREHALKGKILSEIATVHESESKSLCLDGVEFEVSQAGVNVSTKSISETAGASSGSDKLKDHTTADNNVGHFDMPVKFATTQVLTGSNFLSNKSLEKDHNLSANIPSSKDLLPFGQVKNGTAPKSHHVQLVERHTGFRMISTAGAFADARLPRESRWAEELLLECALAISSKNVVRTQHLMWVLNDLGCLTGDANQRLAAHGLKSLFCKVTGTGDAAGFNPTLGHVNGGAKTVHRALLKFHDVNPWHHMVYTVANSVMIDNFEGEEKVHVVDIGVSQGTQWPTFIEALATRASGPPLLRLTVVKDDEGAATPRVPQGSSSTDFMVQLERFAKLMGIQIELHTVVSSLEKLTRRKLGLKEGEALAICAQFRLHRLPEATGEGELGEVSLERGNPGLSPRDKFLQFMHELQPKVVILSENDTDHLDSDFVTRFRPTVDYLWKFLDSTSYSFHGKHSQERQIIEYEAAMAMVNNVACEGSHRIERNESHRGWTRRMERAGFVPVLPREEILDNIRTLVMKYDTNWEFGTDLNCVVLLWKHQPVTFCSVWKPM